MAKTRRTKKKVTPRKKKSKARRRSKSSAFSSFKKDFSKNITYTAKLLRKALLWALLVFIIAVLVLLFRESRANGTVSLPFLDSLFEDRKPLNSIIEEKEPARKIEKVLKLEIPSGYAYGKEQILRREGFTISYNADYKIPNWVAYELTADEAAATKVSRYKKFLPDPDVRGNTDFNYDYSANDYDRGHMVPAGDMKWSFQAMKESFYFTNICPQSPKLNGGIWADLEMQCRAWAKTKKVVFIAAGPVIEKEMEHMGKNRIAIPQQFFKVVCTQLADGSYEGVGFLFENRPYVKTKIKEMSVPIRSVEAVTGIDFFSVLPDEVEEAMETAVNERFWFR